MLGAVRLFKHGQKGQRPAARAGQYADSAKRPRAECGARMVAAKPRSARAVGKSGPDPLQA